MKNLSPAVRISIGLASLLVSVLFAAHALGLVPDPNAPALARRVALCEAVAVHCSLAAERNDMAAVRAIVRAAVERNPEVLSAAIRQADDRLLAEVGDHAARWELSQAGDSTASQVQVPVVQKNKSWGTVELRFRSLEATGILAAAQGPFRLIAFVSLTCLGLYYVYFRMTLRRLNVGPSTGVPERVRDTLDNFVEGVLVLDRNERISLANQAFAKLAGQSPTELEAQHISELPWSEHHSEQAIDFPWSRTQSTGTAHTGTILQLSGQTGRQTLSANATPITSDDGTQWGVLVTFDNLTTIDNRLMTIEKENSQLQSLIRMKQFDPEFVERFIQVASSIHTDRESPLPAPDQPVVMQIGLQSEKLAAALDRTDFAMLAAMASRLEQTATEHGIAQIADVAGQLQQAVTAEKDNFEIVHLTMELLGQCRAAQRSYLKQFEQDWPPEPQSNASPELAASTVGAT